MNFLCVFAVYIKRAKWVVVAMNKYSKPRVLSNGTLIYPKRGTPPPLPEGFRRKSDNLVSPDAWVMIPLWRDCPFRIRQTSQREDCKCITYVYFCGHPKNEKTPLTVGLCEKCLLINLK